MHFADQHRLDLVSRSLSVDAATLLRMQGLLVAELGGLSWHSPAARVFEVALHGALAELRRLCARLDELALLATAMLDRLSRVDHRLAALTDRVPHRLALPAIHRSAATAR